MRFNPSVIIALLMLLIIGLWFVINSGNDEAGSKTPDPNAFQAEEIPKVVVEIRVASEHQKSLQLYGRSEANREVQVKAETAGLVIATPIKEGRTIKRGAVLCRQDIDARKAMLDQAKAMLKTRELEFKAAKTLVEKGFRSETQAATAQAALDGSRAAVKQAEIELDNVNMRAPFGGVFETQIAEIGDYLAPGQPCGLLVELDPLIVTSQLTEQQVGLIKAGQSAEISLATGEQITGTVRRIESRANPSTRTFRTEIAVPNNDLSLKAGLTATVRVKAGTEMAQHIPGRIMTLSDDGVIGVKYLDSEDIVRFAVTQTIDEDESGVWVTGLPDSIRIIVTGQDYVSVGTKTDPRFPNSDQSNAAQ